MFSAKVLVLFTITIWCVVQYVVCQDSAMDDFFMKASKNIPRIGRSNSKSSKGSNDDFENFFLKASKSVPRIGRRDRGFNHREHLEQMMRLAYLRRNPENNDSDKVSNPNDMDVYAGLPVSELSKNNPYLKANEILAAFDTMNQGSSKEEDLDKITIN